MGRPMAFPFEHIILDLADGVLERQSAPYGEKLFTDILAAMPRRVNFSPFPGDTSKATSALGLTSASPGSVVRVRQGSDWTGELR